MHWAQCSWTHRKVFMMDIITPSCQYYLFKKVHLKALFKKQSGNQTQIKKTDIFDYTAIRNRIYLIGYNWYGVTFFHCRAINTKSWTRMRGITFSHIQVSEDMQVLFGYASLDLPAPILTYFCSSLTVILNLHFCFTSSFIVKLLFFKYTKALDRAASRVTLPSVQSRFLSGRLSSATATS